MADEDNDIAKEIDDDDDAPGWTKEGTEQDDISIDGEDISKAEQMERSDVIEPAKGVEMTIKSIKVDKYTPEGKNDWRLINIEPMLVVGEKGVDGKGRYKNKHFFPRILVAVNRASKEYDWTHNAAGKPSDFYSPSGGAFGDYNAFLTALGFKTSPAPKNDAAFRQSLVGRKILVDITKDRKRVKDSTGKYVYVDEYENKLIYKGAPKAAPKSDVAEAAAS